MMFVLPHLPKALLGEKRNVKEAIPGRRTSFALDQNFSAQLLNEVMPFQ